MTLLLISVLFFALAMLGMGLGVLLGRPGIRGSCGGLNRIPGLEGQCSGCNRACKNARRQTSRPDTGQKS